MRRAALAVTGWLLGGLAATAFLVAAMTLQVGMLDPQTALHALQAIALALAMAGADPTGLPLAEGLHLIWLALVLVTFGPVGLAALIGACFGRMTLFGMALLAGIAATALPAGLVVAHGVRDGGGPLLPIVFLAGILGGCVHWLVAGSPRQTV